MGEETSPVAAARWKPPPGDTLGVYSKTLVDERKCPLRTRGELLKKGGSRGSGGPKMPTMKMPSMIPTMSLPPMMQKSLAMTTRRNWQSRWFSLDVDRGEMRYFEDQSLRSFKGLAQLTPETKLSFDMPAPTSMKGKHSKGVEELFYFELTEVKDEHGVMRSKPLACRALTIEEFEEWKRSLAYSLRIVQETAASKPVDVTNGDAPLYTDLVGALKQRRNNSATEGVASPSSSYTSSPRTSRTALTEVPEEVTKRISDLKVEDDDGFPPPPSVATVPRRGSSVKGAITGVGGAMSGVGGAVTGMMQRGWRSPVVSSKAVTDDEAPSPAASREKDSAPAAEANNITPLKKTASGRPLSLAAAIFAQDGDEDGTDDETEWEPPPPPPLPPPPPS